MPRLETGYEECQGEAWEEVRGERSKNDATFRTPDGVHDLLVMLKQPELIAVMDPVGFVNLARTLAGQELVRIEEEQRALEVPGDAIPSDA